MQQSGNGYRNNLSSAIVEFAGFNVDGKTSYGGTDRLIIISQRSLDYRLARALLADHAA